MNLHWTAQFAILSFAALEWALGGYAMAPAAERPRTPDVAAEQTAAQEWRLDGDRLLVTNLIGHVTVGSTTESQIVVRARLGGANADALQVKVEEGSDAELHVIFPLREHRNYVYPEMGQRSRTQFRGWDPRSRSGAIQRLFESLRDRRIEVRGRPWGDAIEAWADLEVLLPQGKAASVRLGVGRIDAAEVRSALDLDTRTGDVTARDITGDLSVDTGSGDVAAAVVRGNVNIDTGSGDVEAEGLEGRSVRIDTGSGDVTARNVRATEVDIDTGSGSVDATLVQASGLRIDTGSGDVAASEITTDAAEIDTGSGSVTLDLVAMGAGLYEVDTGSGRVRVTLPANPSARIRASTGSGGIDLDLPTAKITRLSRSHVALEVGDAAADVVIETGSGGILIRARS